MNAQEAAELCAALRPRYAVPIHYAFRGNALTERLVIKHSHTGAEDFVAAARQLCPETEARILAPGKPLTVSARMARQKEQIR
jgi:L-ascorbate metabolism protein UlaG (beta-lactamase superfamily)